jgi:hypothetical protein
METSTESPRPPKRQVDAAAKACFLTGLRAGLPRDEAARAAGFTANAFYQACKRDPVFALGRVMALELSAAEGRAARGPRGESPPPCDTVITPTGGRLLQKRHVRRPRFDDRRKRRFLDDFATHADAEAACATAGIAYSTYVQHRRKDPEFDAACDEALIVAYAALEAEAVRERLEAQRNLRDGLCPGSAPPRDFDKTMRLLERYDRKGGGIGPRRVTHGGQRRGDFLEAIAWFDDRLRALGARHGVIADPVRLPPPASDEAPDGGE